MQIGVVEHRAGHDAIARQRHALRHGATQAAQHLDIPLLAVAGGSGRGCGCRMHLARAPCVRQPERHHIVECHEAAAAAAADLAQVDAETARQRARGRHRAHARPRDSIGGLEDGIGFIAAAGHVSDDGAASPARPPRKAPSRRWRTRSGARRSRCDRRVAHAAPVIVPLDRATGPRPLPWRSPPTASAHRPRCDRRPSRASAAISASDRPSPRSGSLKTVMRTTSVASGRSHPPASRGCRRRCGRRRGCSHARADTAA